MIRSRPNPQVWLPLSFTCYISSDGFPVRLPRDDAFNAISRGEKNIKKIHTLGMLMFQVDRMGVGGKWKAKEIIIVGITAAAEKKKWNGNGYCHAVDCPSFSPF